MLAVKLQIQKKILLSHRNRLLPADSPQDGQPLCQEGGIAAELPRFLRRRIPVDIQCNRLVIGKARPLKCSIQKLCFFPARQAEKAVITKIPLRHPHCKAVLVVA